MLIVYYLVMVIGGVFIGHHASKTNWTIWQLIVFNILWICFLEQGYRTLMSWQHHRRIIDRLTR